MIAQLPGLDPQSILRKLSSIVDQNSLQVSILSDLSFFRISNSDVFVSLLFYIQHLSDPDLVENERHA